MIDYNKALEKLRLIDQQDLLKYWQELTPSEQEKLLNDIDQLDLKLFYKQQALLDLLDSPFTTITPVTKWEQAGNKERKETGKQLVAQGKVGCIIVAGGQGTRLKFEGPKGLFPISPIKGKTLFQLFAEKILAAGKQANRALPVAIMTSAYNAKTTEDYFKEHNFFGLAPDQLDFFNQGSLPFLNDIRDLFLETKSSIAKGPDGNGSIYQTFVESGLCQKWKDQGVSYVNIVLIDNPLADPFDFELAALHAAKNAEVTIKACPKANPNENVGVLAMSHDRIIVKEYSELSENDKKALEEQGGVPFGLANLSLYCMNLEFFDRVATKLHIKLPLHKAFKSASYLSKEGKLVVSKEPNAWKFEKYIFDALFYSNRTEILVYPRNQCFAPLKSFEGSNSPETVKEALLQSYRDVFSEITGIPANSVPFEISQQFYYPTEELMQKWKGKTKPSDEYIEA